MFPSVCLLAQWTVVEGKKNCLQDDDGLVPDPESPFVWRRNPGEEVRGCHGFRRSDDPLSFPRLV